MGARAGHVMRRRHTCECVQPHCCCAAAFQAAHAHCRLLTDNERVCCHTLSAGGGPREVPGPLC